MINITQIADKDKFSFLRACTEKKENKTTTAGAISKSSVLQICMIENGNSRVNGLHLINEQGRV
jgi:hypothetical protein